MSALLILVLQSFYGQVQFEDLPFVATNCRFVFTLRPFSGLQFETLRSWNPEMESQTFIVG